jgi:uncharacterized coiled-coil DUF342 family protein
MPKPPEAPFIRALEQEVETYQHQVRLFSESLNVHKLERDAIRENVRTARDASKRCRDAFDAKNAEVKPLRDALQTGGQATRKLREEYADLEARSEPELDTKLAALNNRIEHESIPLNEEKKIIASIKKLEAQRPRVREFETTVGVVAEVRADIDKLRAELHEHDAELSVLRKEKDTQQAILTKFREQEAEADAKVEAAMAERRRVKDLQDAAYTRMNEARKSQRTKNDAHFTNRRLSRAVRELIAAGKVEKARAMCAEQMEEMHEKLASNDEYRAQYYTQWEEVKKMKSEAEGSDEHFVGNGGDSDMKGGKPKSTAASVPKEPVVEPALKAQAVIAAALEAASVADAEATAVVAQPIAVSAHHSKNVSLEDASLLAGAAGISGAATGGVKAKKSKQQPKYIAAEPLVEPEDNFTLPEAALKKEAEPSTTAATKAAERERNRQLQAEAEARKQKREAEKAKRKAKAEQLEKESLVKAKAAAAAALRGTPTGGEASKKSAAAAAELAAASEATTALAAAQKAGKGADDDEEEDDEDEYHFSTPVLVGPRKSTQLLKAGAARPVAKRPVRNWRRGIFQQIQDLLEDLADKENAIWIAVICLLIILIITTLMQD